MRSIGIFFKTHWEVMVIGLVGVLLGVILNKIMRGWENKKFLDSLSEQLNKLEDKAKSGSLSDGELKLMDKLKDEIFIMKFRCEA